jgi:hypothetical protein
VGGASANVTFDGYLNCAGGLTTDTNGKLVCNASDERLKQNITPLNATSTLAAIDELNPVSFNWRDPSMSTNQQFGLIAQQVQQVFPNLVTVTNPTALTPDGTLTVNYLGLVAPMILSIQQLDARFSLPTNTNASSTLPSAVLTADGKSVNLYQLATFAVSNVQTLSNKITDLDTRMTSLETRVAALENGTVSSSSSSPVDFSSSTLASALSGFGAFVQKGIAQFGILVADQFVAATNSAGASSAGSVTILAGNTVAEVSNSYVNPSSKIFVTLTASTTGSWYISDKQNGSFKLTLSAPQTSDVSFDYFIVQTEGQIATSTPNSSEPSATNDQQPATSENGSSTSSSPRGTPPVITMLGDNPIRVPIGGDFVDPGATAIDAIDGTDPVVTYINGVEQVVSSATIDSSSPTTYTITYKSTDSAGNTGTATRSVIIGNPSSSTNPTPQITPTPTSTDTTPPVVTLNGDAALQINVGDSFTDPGATATDTVDGNLTAKIVETGSVDTTTAGLYTLTYTATDAAGNSASVSRVVTVVIAAPASTSTPITSSDSTDSASSSPTTQ